MEENNREKKQTATKTVGGKKRKRIITNHDDDDDDDKKRCWSDLPYEILELIKKLLFFIDQVNFHAVCKSWSCIERVTPLQQIPWLLVFDNVDSLSYSSNKKTHWNSSGKEKHIVDSCILVDSKNNKTYTIDAANVIKAKLRIANFKAMKVHESKYGWLLISSYLSNDQHDYGSRLFLYSPFFSEGYNLIELPVLNFKIFWATFTSNPLDKDCTILTLNTNYYDNTFLIYTYRGRGDQGSWSSQNFPGNSTIQNFSSWCSYQNWMYSEGNFYFASSGDCTMGKFDMVLGEWSVFPVLPLIALAESSGLAGLIRMARESLSSLHHYIVKSLDGSELFLISDPNTKHVCWDYDYYSGQTKHQRWGYSKSPHIHRLNLSSMIWEDLDSIGDHVLFIGDGYNSLLNSSVLKSNGEQIDISDKIYYCKDDNLKYCSVHDYTLKTKTKNYYSNGKLYQEKNCSRHYGPIATKSCRKMFIDPPPR